MSKTKEVNNSSISEKIGSNIFFLSGGEIISRIVAYLGLIFIAYRLGPEQFGIIGFATTIYWFIALAIAGGINDIGSQEISRQPRRAASIAANVLILRILLAIILVIALRLSIALLNKTPTVKSVIFLTCLLLLPLALDTSWVYKGLQRNRPIAFTLIFSQILYVIGIILFVKTPQDVEFVPIVQLVGETSAVLILLIPLLNFSEIQIDFNEGFKIFQKAVFRTISLLMRTITLIFDTVLIGFILGEKYVGLYNAPYRICFLLLAISNAVHASYLPVFSITLNQEQLKSELAEIANRSIYFSTVIAAPIIVGGFFTSALIIEKLFGAQYLEGQNALRLLILSMGFIFIQGTIHNMFLVFNRLTTELWIFSLAAVLNIGLNLIIISRYGITGAAFVTAFTELLTLLLGFVVISRIAVPIRLWIIWKPVLASIVMGLCLCIPVINQTLTGGLLIGSFTYIFALIIFKGVPVEISQFLRTIPLSFIFLKRGSPKS